MALKLKKKVKFKKEIEKKKIKGFKTSKMSFLNNCLLEMFEKMAIFEKKGNFLKKKMAIFQQFFFYI